MYIQFLKYTFIFTSLLFFSFLRTLNSIVIHKETLILHYDLSLPPLKTMNA